MTQKGSLPVDYENSLILRDSIETFFGSHPAATEESPTDSWIAAGCVFSPMIRIFTLHLTPTKVAS